MWVDMYVIFASLFSFQFYSFIIFLYNREFTHLYFKGPDLSLCASYGKHNSMWEHPCYHIFRLSELFMNFHTKFSHLLYDPCVCLFVMTGISITSEVGVYRYRASLSDVVCWVMTLHPSVLLSCSTSDSIKYVLRIYWLKNHKSPTKTLAWDHLRCSPWSAGIHL